MRHKDTTALYHYWTELRAGRAAPERHELSPAALGALLPSVFILQPRASGAMTFRLAGTGVCAYRCEELREQAFSALFTPGDYKTVDRMLAAVRGQSTMAVLEVDAPNAAGHRLRSEMLLLPLAPDMILGIWSVFSKPYWLGAKPVEDLELQSLRLMDPDAPLAFLQNRPAIPLADRHRREETPPPASPSLNVIEGTGNNSGARRPFVFRVLHGGKK